MCKKIAIKEQQLLLLAIHYYDLLQHFVVSLLVPPNIVSQSAVEIGFTRIWKCYMRVNG